MQTIIFDPDRSLAGQMDQLLQLAGAAGHPTPHGRPEPDVPHGYVVDVPDDLAADWSCRRPAEQSPPPARTGPRRGRRPTGGDQQ